MAGGNWTAQNKVRPGVYINFTSNNELGLSIGERGVVAICEPMSWGPVSEVMTVEAGVDTTPFCGYDIFMPQARFLNEIFKGTNRTNPPTKVLLYRPAADSSAEAKATTGQLTITALYPGVRGNDVTIIVAEDADDEGTFTVQTIVDGLVVDTQTGANVSDLRQNKWVSFSGTGALTPTAGTKLAGGADGTVQAAAYAAFLTNIEPYKFDVLIYDGTDTTTMAAMLNFVERMVTNEGKYTQLVAANLSTPDTRFAINVNTGVTLKDGTILTPQQTCWWVGGAQAGAKYNESLTYASYPGAVDASPKLTNGEIVSALTAGQFLLIEDDGNVKVEWDINSLTTYTADIPKVYHKNRVIRLCNTIANDLYRQFSDNFIGVVNNNDEGRALFKSVIVGYLLEMQGNQAIQNFTADDVEVLPGDDIDSIIINIAIYAVDAAEKLYITISVS
ncbi:MAG: phage tail sheath family protein [Candidatus Metalachnospira sp.]|nr:phage tail sheath family protein [Candidatus Metalachnospira sp.]